MSNGRFYIPYIIMSLGFLLLLGGCSYFQEKEDPSVTEVITKEKAVRFSENPSMGTFNPKMYKRSTRKSLEEESEVHARAGSFWNAEGQSGYLFTQNTARREGDALSIKLEGAPKDQVLTKVDVIKKLIARLDAPPPPTTPEGEDSTFRGIASEDNNVTPGVPSKLASTGSDAKVAAVQKTAPAAVPTTEAKPEEEFKVDQIPTKVVERLADGNYRVKGAQTFMIGKREFKVIVTGMIRPEDFNEDGISATRVLDPQFDVVSVRRSQMQ